jgi:putative cardiolipin synthase
MARFDHRAVLSIAFTLVVVSGCATLPQDFDRPVSVAFSDTQDTAIGTQAGKLAADHPGQSGFRLLGSGLDAFVARAVLAQSAERSIDAQYYLYHDDRIGRLFTELLVRAADRGVRVRLLVDDMDLSGRDLGVAVLDSHPNVEVRIFNPFSRKSGRLLQFITRMGEVTRRMHNKSFTVDNQATILGGRNIGDEYFAADPDLAFEDLDVLAIGPVAKEVSASFDLYWNSELAYPASVLGGAAPSPETVEAKRQQLRLFVEQQKDSPYTKALWNSDLAEDLRNRRDRFCWGDATIVYDQPEKLLHDFDRTEFHLAPQIAPYFDGVAKELILFSPYFVPGRSGTAFLTGLAERGVRVRILTNSLASNDVGIVHAGYAKYRRALLRGGVELYELDKKLNRNQRKEQKGKEGGSKASLHAKSFVFDREQVFVGSLNLDPRAVVHNTEIGAVITCPAISEGMGQWFDRNMEQVAFRLELFKDHHGEDSIRWHGMKNGQPVSYVTEPYVGFWRRFAIGFLSLLPIESQL